jgi:hypothetical protein
MDHRQAALEYARQGTAVFPCRPDSKAPLTAHGFKDATTSQPLVRYWWRKWPEALIGLPTGHGLVVVDVDPRSGGTLDPGWPDTLTARTRSGGRHLYYASRETVPCSVGRLARGVDIRGEGGYVILPPSPGWEWLDPEAAVAELPDWMRSATNRASGGRGDRFEPATRVGEGARNSYMASYVGWLLRTTDDIGDGELAELAHAHNETVCWPPLPASEVDGVIRSIQRTHAHRSAA